MPCRRLQQPGSPNSPLISSATRDCRGTDESFTRQDRSILGVATPVITTEFNSFGDVGWYGSAYLLSPCCFQLLVGKLYAHFDVKRVFVAALAIFEVGSVICAAAPTSACLIVGRAVAGLGATGISTGALLVRITSTS